MLMHFIDAVWALPMAPACLLMLPARSTSTVANCSVPGRHHLDANGFALRSLLVLPVTMAAMRFHVLQKMVAAMGGVDEVHERTRPSTVWTTSRASTCVGGVQGHHRGVIGERHDLERDAVRATGPEARDYHRPKGACGEGNLNDRCRPEDAGRGARLLVVEAGGLALRTDGAGQDGCCCRSSTTTTFLHCVNALPC
jgi:hypothetical protein